MKPYLSIVIPVYNEAKNLQPLFSRLATTLDKLGKTYEIIFINDGSKDNSEVILEDLYRLYLDKVRIITFSRNFGQHMAIMAGFESSQGEIIVTLDADLQNPPEEIPKLLELIDKGHDLVSGIRLYERKDSWFRRNISIIINKIRALTTHIDMTDHGCMLRAYNRSIIDLIVAHDESSIFIPALAYSHATNPAEIKVDHEARVVGKSKYSLYGLIRLNFDLMTGYSLVPLQIFTIVGFSIAFLSILFVIFLFIRRLIIGPEVQGVFTLFAIAFFLIGVVLIGLGIMGEYVGRIYKEVQHRPRFSIKKVLGVQLDEKDTHTWH
ncbi:MAG: glycosyltransferase [Coxiellaceae bacterium]|jgi:undecaprenyl-phosphate 4-deoxy-4-formamido-L-arabinose transferase|nr:glycosyltransferase [Coxiellaceae bacterium]